MDFPKFYSLLRTSQLYFPSANVLHLVDPFEGSLPRREYDNMLKRMNRDSIVRAAQNFRENTLISCWHFNDAESVAMWKIYSQLGNGIVISTSFSDFKDAFEEAEEDVYAGKVIYVDYNEHVFYQGEKDFPTGLNVFMYFIHKRSIYRGEQEYRAVISTLNSTGLNTTGKFIKVSLPKLVRDVVLSPESPQWMLELTNSVLGDHLPSVKAHFSSFHEQPIV